MTYNVLFSTCAALLACSAKTTLNCAKIKCYVSGGITVAVYSIWLFHLLKIKTKKDRLQEMPCSHLNTRLSLLQCVHWGQMYNYQSAMQSMFNYIMPCYPAGGGSKHKANQSLAK